MPGILYTFFSPRHYDEEAKLLQKIWAVLPKYTVYYFTVSTIFIEDPLKEGPGQLSPMTSFLILSYWDP